MLKLTTDRHEASHGLSATAQLLVKIKFKKTGIFRSSTGFSAAAYNTNTQTEVRMVSTRTGGVKTGQTPKPDY